MPEMPEVEAVAQRLREAAVGEKILRMKVMRPSMCRPQLPEDLETAVQGKMLKNVHRRGKHLFFTLSGGTVLHAHLRMTGNIFAIPDARLHSANARVIFTLASGRGIVFEDARALGKLHLATEAQMEAVNAELGWEPLDPSFTLEEFQNMAKKSAKPSKSFLMDQQYVAGLGNIYVAEALFRAKVNPVKPMKNLKATSLAHLYDAIRGVMREAVESVRGAYEQPGAFAEGEHFPVQVYGREGEPCFVCRRKIRRIPQGGRSTYFCPDCQR